MGFSWKLLGSPAVGNALKTVTFGDSNNVDVLVLFKDGRDIDGFLEFGLSEGDLVSDGSTVDLNLHEVSLLLAQTGLADLSVGKNADDSTVFTDALKLTISRLAAVLGVLLCVAGESLFLRSVPVPVEPSLELLAKVGSPDSGESPEATRSLNVSNDTDNNDGGCLDNCDCFNNLAFVHFCGNQ